LNVVKLIKWYLPTWIVWVQIDVFMGGLANSLPVGIYFINTERILAFVCRTRNLHVGEYGII